MRSTGRRRRVVAGAVLAGVLVSGLALGACASPVPVAPGPSAPPASVTDEAGLVEAADTLLTAREEALRAGDSEAYAALVAGPTRTGGAALLAEMGTVGALPLERMAHDRPRVVAAADLPASAVPAGAATDAPEGAVHVRTTVAYRLAGERADSRGEEFFTLVRVDGSWRLVDHTATATALAPWWLPGVRVVTTPHGVVVGTAAPETLQSTVRAVDRASELAAAAWPTGGRTPPLVVVAPATAAEYVTLTRSSGSSNAQVGAVTDGPLDAEGRATGDRVIVNPDAVARLTPEGRDFLIAHEAVHVLTRAELPGQAPLWLAEGFADWVAYRPTGLPATTVAQQALQEVRARGLPTRLPDQGDFNAEAATIGPAYQRSWVLVSLLVDRYGEERLRELVRASTVPGSQADAETAADTALVSVLGTTREQLLTDWQERLRALAATG